MNLKLWTAAGVALAGGASLYAMNSGMVLGGSGHAVGSETLEQARTIEVHDHGAGEATLWGIYGRHDVHDCPLNNREIAEYVVEASRADVRPLMEKYGVTAVRDRYHSGLEHTFVWAVETTRPHDLELFAVELGIASWNDLKIVPLITFEDGVVPMVSRVHGIE
jgi:hypothetical protein